MKEFLFRDQITASSLSHQTSLGSNMAAGGGVSCEELTAQDLSHTFKIRDEKLCFKVRVFDGIDTETEDVLCNCRAV